MRKPNLKQRFALSLLGLAAASSLAAAVAAPVMAQDRDHKTISNNMARCSAGAGPALQVTVSGIKSSRGMVRVQSYRATEADWLEKGQWINRIEVPAQAGTMTFCVPLPASGSYGIAVRHDINGNGKTDLREDGGGMSNNPSINIFNLGKPSYKKTATSVGDSVRPISIAMRYW
ncbi:MAG: hypothetical protein A3J40_10200 [Erythrobacter sp. RIFCSPHIGHO2_12_FULL_63_10]|nr:MAG: hypothetical protein A3J40_10200 [Erythrobacter sp. RIFCSPHIGHO2_12_FULL_63_10]